MKPEPRRRPAPRWRTSRFGDNLELVCGRKWLGTVGPEIGGECRYQTPDGAGVTSTQDEAKRRVEKEALNEVNGTADEKGEAATRRTLAALDTMADAWARGARLTEAVVRMLAQDDRESRVETFIKLAWTEGAWAARRGLSIQEIEELGRGK